VPGRVSRRLEKLRKQRVFLEAATGKAARDLDLAAQAGGLLSNEAVKTFFDTWDLHMFERIQETDPSDAEGLQEIRYLMEAAKIFRGAMEHFINSGKAATMKLPELRERLGANSAEMRRSQGVSIYDLL
jgi:hypothetical protein